MHVQSGHDAGYALTAGSRAGVGALAQLYFDIAIWRRGPQHVPSAGILLPLTLAVYFAVNALLNALLPAGPDDVATGVWTLQLCADMAFMLGWYWVLLRLFGRTARYRQTITAIFGCQIVLTPPVLVSGWLVQRYGDDAALQLPVYLGAVAVLLWTLLAVAHILRAALERTLAVTLALAFLQLLSEGLLVYALAGTGG
jgi:hypothetical protein